ncbi:MAG: cytochrome c oxidase assembly protein [Micropruina sp.]|uniref:cytochrome c oxidase assembly protein n=1 Tax=Micropruina sp. TaxID=2737536 RepID=UPI0039E2D814
MAPLPPMLPLHADPRNQPPPLTPDAVATAWTFDPWVVAALIAMVGLYLWGVRRLVARGDSWPLSRTLSWCVGGAGVLAIAMLSVLGTYDTVLFSVHMVQHILLSMVAPVLMAVGAPLTLLLRNLGALGRKRVVAVLHSWPVRVLTWPPLATAMMIANPYLLYMTGLYPLTLANDWLHAWMHLHFVIVGCLYFWPLLGLDPMPTRLPHYLRMLLIFVTLPFHAFLGVIIMGTSELIAEDWYLAFNRAWPPSPLEDQNIAGGVMWGAGDLISLIILAVFFVQWYQHSQREAIRIDRQLDREERLAALAAAARYDAADTPGQLPADEERA